MGDTKCCHLLWTVSWQELVANQGGLTLLVVLFHSSLHSTTVNWEIFVGKIFVLKIFRGSASYENILTQKFYNIAFVIV